MAIVDIHPAAEGDKYRELTALYGSPLLILDCHTVQRQYQTLQQALPGVKLYYAVKSLPHAAIVSTLNQLGCGFDLATSGEIELVRQLAVNPLSCIHTHPIKSKKDISDALRYGCTTFVVDNAEELKKFEPYRSRVGILLRVSFRSEGALVDLSKKFGCNPEDVRPLLDMAKSLGIHIKGLSFHVGSQCKDASMQVQAIETCNTLIRDYYGQGAAPISTLDIGGGFPAAYDGNAIDIEGFCAPIREALAQLPSYVKVIAEPGRYISAPAVTGVSTVMGKAQRGDQTWYYLDDGVYGSYSGQIFDHVNYPLEVYSDNNERKTSVLSGPTCDSIDVIAEQLELPELELGELIVGREMGAYTAATATEFNSIKKAQFLVVNNSLL